MVRIVILGCAGSGKTTLARLLGERRGAPVICLDDIWRPHWGEQEVPLFRSLIKKAHGGTSGLATATLRGQASISGCLALLW